MKQWTQPETEYAFILSKIKLSILRSADTIKIFNFTRSSLRTKSNFKLRDTFYTNYIFGIFHSQTGYQKVTYNIEYLSNCSDICKV